ncbi:MAG: D-alanine--D-alanine ligase [Bacilli bacterium]|nr:D-alanine--D-alanine ligase [Bacilli bacterium]
MKLNIGVIFGGNSLEHELSILTAIQAMDNIDKERYEIVPIYITKDLTMYTGGMLRYIDSYKDFNLINRYAKKVNLVNKNGKFILQTTGMIKREYKEIHLAFPMVHGKNTEDGGIVGFLETIGIPFVGSDIYASSLCQDKIFTKEVLLANNISVTDYVDFTDIDYKMDKEDIFKKIDKLSYPLIVKPARLGSSIGIEIVSRKEELESSIEKVMQKDDRILVEEYIEKRSEYNMAVLLSKGKLIGSMIEQIEKDSFCDYYDKYHKDDDKDDSFKRTYPAEISKALTEEIEKTSKEVFKILSLHGVARIDYIYDNKKKKLYVNEINTVPNFFSHHLFEDKNIDYRELLGIMIKEAIDKIHKEETMIKSIDDIMFKKVTSKDVRNMK